MKELYLQIKKDFLKVERRSILEKTKTRRRMKVRQIELVEEKRILYVLIVRRRAIQVFFVGLDQEHTANHATTMVM